MKSISSRKHFYYYAIYQSILKYPDNLFTKRSEGKFYKFEMLFPERNAYYGNTEQHSPNQMG